jgi:spore coat protein CotF
MKDKDIIADILETEKNMVVNMAIALNEASCQNLYDKYFEMFTGLSQATKNLFALAYNNSWYQLEQANQDKILEASTKLNNEIKK